MAPDVDPATPPAAQIGRLGGVEFLARAAELMKKFPPHGNDYPLLLRMRALGLEPGRDWRGDALDQAGRDAVEAGARDAQQDIAVAAAKAGVEINGWHVLADNVGTYGTSYLRRAAVAFGDPGAPLPADLLLAAAAFDKDGQVLNGSDRYVIHFDRGQLPPPALAWSLTLYDGAGFAVANPLNRFALGSRDRLNFNEDGSLDLYIQADSPGPEKIPNWLPTPKRGPIAPVLRLYVPGRAALHGDWAPPPLHRTNWR